MDAPESALAHAEKHLDSAFVCPMHPQIVRTSEGSCPICGMDLIEKQTRPTKDTALDHAQKHLDPKYVCPMHPQIVRDEPSNCPICGMDLVAKAVGSSEQRGRPIVTISGEVAQNMGVRTLQLRRGTLWRFIKTVGRVEYDETRMAHVHPRAAGWMEKLKIRAEGEHVKRGQILGHFYSEDILAAQVDFLIALNQKGRANTKIRIDKAKNRLRLLGVPEGTIRRIEKRGTTQNTVPVVAPSKGVITMLGAREGMFLKTDMEMVTISDLSKIWVMVDVFEHQIDWLKLGIDAEITVPAYPGRSWKGKVDYIYPELNMKSRTLRVRLIFDNPDELLKANMFAEVKIYGGPKPDVLIAPSEALIVTGQRKSIVKALGNGRFEPVDVVTGMQRNGQVEILSGLEAGDQIVTSGQFLIDSESSLQASFLRMSEQ